jgi:hypothetical protein
MHQPTADCSELITKTADALDSDILQQLLISTQRNNLTLCKQYAIEKRVSQALKQMTEPNSLTVHRVIVPAMIQKDPSLNRIEGGLKWDEIARISIDAWQWIPYHAVS